MADGMPSQPATPQALTEPEDDLAVMPPSPIAAMAIRLLLTTLPGLAFLIFWEWASGRLISAIYVSRPSDIIYKLVNVFVTGEIYPHLIVTFQELALGYSIGVTAGVLAGYAFGRLKRVAEIFEPYVMAFYGIPKIALTPLFIIWFGIGLWSKVVLAATMVFFLMFYNVYLGVRQVDREFVRLGLIMGANQRQLTWHIYLPSAAPFVIAGMRMAIPYSVIGVIVGEFTSSIKGLGLFITQSSSTYDPAGVFAGIAILLVFILFANMLASRLERRLLRWHPKTSDSFNEI